MGKSKKLKNRSAFYRKVRVIFFGRGEKKSVVQQEYFLKHDGTQHHLIGFQPDFPIEKTMQGIKNRKDYYSLINDSIFSFHK